MRTTRTALSRPWSRLGTLGTALCALALSSVAAAEDAPPPAPPPAPTAPGAPPPGPAVGPGSPGWRAARESMWPAPTAEDWKKPCLITWQRSWADAQAVAKETGKPILICINMDGEIASEHYAGVRYRQPEIAALYEPYVTVVASVYRHTPRDYDDQGRRIPCPRFGTVTCGEHIAIEPIIFEKYCDGQRVAPRHIMVELDGKEAYDVYYRNDTASVFQDVKDGIARRAPPPATVVRGDRPVVERVASRDVRDRAAVEAAYQSGDPALRRALLDAADKNPDAAQLDLLRLAVFGFDADLSRVARRALTDVKAPEATDLVIEALRVPMDAPERDALLGTLKRLGESSPVARWLAVVHTGLAGKASPLDVRGWSGARADGKAPVAPGAPDWAGLEAQRARREDASKAHPEDGALKLELAEASLALAREAPTTYLDDPKKGGAIARHMYADARKTGREAEALGATGARLNTVLALAAYYTGDLDEAYARAAAAVKALPPDEPSWNSMAVVTVYAESRWKGIRAAVRARKDWPPEWLADLHAAYAVLLRHPLGTDAQVVWHYDFLVWLGANAEATRILKDGLARFSTSPVLHERLRERLLADQGAEALEAAYATMLAAKDAPPGLEAFAGAAGVAVAEHDRRTRAFEAALVAYERAIAHLEKAATTGGAAGKDAADHAVALALAGRARVAWQLGDDERAQKEILASLARRPGSAGSVDGMGITPAETAQTVLARLKQAKRDDLAGPLEEAIKKIDPELLRQEGE